MEQRRRFGVAFIIGALFIAAAGCGSSGSSAKPAGGAASGAGATGSSGQSTGPAASGAGDVAVDITVTGADPARIKGTKGQCSIPSNSSLSATYNITGADYPSLGASGGIYVTGPQLATGGGQAAGGQNASPPSVKAFIRGAAYLELDRGITVSADRKKVTLDTDLGEPAKSHMAGTITCG